MKCDRIGDLFKLITHIPCAAGASGGEAEDRPGGGHDEGATCSHGERDGEHASQDTEHLPGAPDHADQGEAYDLLLRAEMNLVV